MRRVDEALRLKFRIAAEELQARGQRVTTRSLSQHLSRNYDAVRTFFDRNRDFAAQLGLEIKRHRQIAEIKKAKETLIAAGTKPTLRRIGMMLDMSHSTVCKRLQKHHCGDVNGSEVKSEQVLEKASWFITLRKHRELTVQFYDVCANRVVLAKVNPQKYVVLWDMGYLKFQIEGKPKPDFMPSREEVIACT